MILVKNKKDGKLYLYAEYQYNRIKGNKNLQIIRDRLEVPRNIQGRRVTDLSVEGTINWIKNTIKKQDRNLKQSKEVLEWLKKLK